MYFRNEPFSARHLKKRLLSTLCPAPFLKKEIFLIIRAKHNSSFFMNKYQSIKLYLTQDWKSIFPISTNHTCIVEWKNDDWDASVKVCVGNSNCNIIVRYTTQYTTSTGIFVNISHKSQLCPDIERHLMYFSDFDVCLSFSKPPNKGLQYCFPCGWRCVGLWSITRGTPR